MNKYFVDTDVIIDLLRQRQPHFHFTAVLFTLAEMGKYELYTAINAGISTLLTRNLKDYKNAALLVQSPEMFLVGNELI